jgi:hypothetical protein
MAQPHSVRDLELFLFLSDLVAVCVCNLIICGDVLLNFGLYLDADAKRDEIGSLHVRSLMGHLMATTPQVCTH